MRNEEERLFPDKQEAIIAARGLERRTGDYYWIVRTLHNEWQVTSRMPLIGECYDAGGIRHG